MTSCSVRHVLLLLALIFAAGCATVEVVPPVSMHEHQLSPGVKPVGHVHANVWGIYLFRRVPLITGNIDDGGMGLPFHIFTDSVRIESLVERVSRESQRRGGVLLTDLQSTDRSYWLGWTLLFWLKEYDVSANASLP
ncbi:MAG: hypothetical protein KF814_06815 [Nitrospiraceae bacterium]|nr:hypothetical protein [Nitrospiraceae bacterium]